MLNIAKNQNIEIKSSFVLCVSHNLSLNNQNFLQVFVRIGIKLLTSKYIIFVDNFYYLSLRRFHLWWDMIYLKCWEWSELKWNIRWEWWKLKLKQESNTIQDSSSLVKYDISIGFSDFGCFQIFKKGRILNCTEKTVWQDETMLHQICIFKANIFQDKKLVG